MRDFANSSHIVCDVTLELDTRLSLSSAPLIRLALGVKEECSGYGSRYAKQSPAQLLAKPLVRVVHAQADRFPNARAAFGWALSNLRGRYRNRDTGWDIAVARRGIEKALSESHHSGGPHIQLIGALPQLIENAVLVESRPPREIDSDVIVIHRLYAATMITGSVYRVRITVKELRTVRNFYDQSPARYNKAPQRGLCHVSPRRTGRSRGSRRAVPQRFLRQWAALVQRT